MLPYVQAISERLSRILLSEPLGYVDESVCFTPVEPGFRSCYINSLPTELLLLVLEAVILSEPPKNGQEVHHALSLVQRSWRITASYLSTLAIVLRYPPDTELFTYNLEARLRGEQGRSQTSPCRSLFVDNRRSTSWTSILADKYARLYRLVAPTLLKLEVTGGWHVWSTVPIKQDLADALQCSFPRLQELALYDADNVETLALIRACGSQALAPRALVIHHDFEVEEERHLLSLPVNEIRLERQPMFVTTTLSNRLPLQLYVRRRHHFVEIVKFLLETEGLPRQCMENGMRDVEVWLKDGEESIGEIEDLVRARHWESFLQRNAKTG